MRHTHTYVTLEISAIGYDEIARKLRDADYGHCFNSSGEIDMTGIAVTRARESTPPVQTFPAYAEPVKPGSQIIEFYACKNPKCDRFACTASAEGYAEFCCVPCSIGARHSRGCNLAIEGMRARLVTPQPVCVYPIGNTTCGYTERAHYRGDGSDMSHSFTPAVNVEKSTPEQAEVQSEAKS